MPAPLAPGPPNGDFSAGIGWIAQGAVAPQPLPTGGVRLVANTTLVSPPVAVPSGAQTLTVAAASPGSAALLDVRARPEGGAPEIDLGVVEPGPVARAFAVPVQGVAGRTVRFVLDPVPAFGSALDVVAVGPLTAPLPGWSVSGTLDVSGSGRRRSVRADGDPLVLVSPSFRPGAGARELLVAVRGDGVARIRVGGRTATLRATASWRDLRVKLPRTGGVISVRIQAQPGAGLLELRDLGLVRRATRVTALRVLRSGPARAVRARLAPAGGRLAVELRDARGVRVARGRSDAAGRVRLSTRARGRLTLVVPGDRTRIGVRVVVRG